MQKNYVTAEEGKVLSFPYDWHQTFFRPFEMSKGMNESVTLKSYIALPLLERQAILEILVDLLEFTFATVDQIDALLKMKGVEVENLQSLLDRCLKSRLVNKFAISMFEMDNIPDDAFIVYCLDHAARHVLSHLYREDIEVTWRSTNAIRSPELVSKYLVTNEFFISLADAKGSALRFFQPTANFSIGKRDIRVSASFCIMKGATPCDFILDVVRHSDIPVYWERKSGEHIGEFLKNYWKRYFVTEPICIFAAEDKEQGLELARIFLRRTENPKFRITTDGEITKGLGNAKFYKYDPEKDALVSVSAAIFKPAASQ